MMPVNIQDAEACQQKDKNDDKVSDGSSHHSYAPPYNPPGPASTIPKLEPLRMPALQSEFIADTMGALKERAAKRQKTGVSAVQSYEQKKASLRGDDDDGRFDLLDELDARPDIIHIVATSGGLVTHWNEAFCKITKPSASLQKIPLTIFELVDSGSLRSLYAMLALALHNIGIVEVEDFSLENDDRERVEEEMGTCSDEEAAGGSDETDKLAKGGPSSSHLSVTLPCRGFCNSSISYNITVVFMNDVASMKRCFLGILTPRTSSNTQDCGSSLSSHRDCFSDAEEEEGRGDDEEEAPPKGRALPSGKILRVDDAVLCQMLLGPSIDIE